MFKKTGPLALSALFVASAVSAAGVDFDRGRFRLSDMVQPSGVEVPAPSAAGPGEKVQKEWTIMVFINGKNDLEPYALKDMNEMEMVGSTDKLNIVTQTGRIDGYDSSDGDWKGVRRYYIEKDADTGKVNSTLAADLGSVDMGDWRSLAEFGRWAKAAYPAKKYMLIVWNHGSGWEKSGKRRVTKGISYDEETNNHITTPQLGAALAAMGKVDVYGSDACLMQMAEVVYEIKDSADYIVGSEETEPGDGYTYNTFVGPVAANPGMSPAELAKVAVDAYSDHYRDERTGSTQSFLKAALIPRFTGLVNAWVDAVMAAGLKAEVNQARSAAMDYAISDNKDLHHFVTLVAGKTQDAAVKARSGELAAFITRDFVLHNRTNDEPGSGGGGWDDYDDWDYYGGEAQYLLGDKWGAKEYSDSKGIAVFLPSRATGAAYAQLAWAGASKWDEFIAWYSAPDAVAPAPAAPAR